MAKYLVNTARTLIFSTALAPPAVAGALAALELLREQPARVEKLQRNATVLRSALAAEGLDVGASETQIIPLVIGEADATVRASERALAHGVFAQAIRPPTVPQGGSRIRLAVMASHTKTELKLAAKVLAAAVAPSMERAPALEPESARTRAAARANGRPYDGIAEAA
jgi:glycine C-acetyltransferase/8-amino-7-oxononanoate synthase